jgi:hypothetical protein
MRRIEQQHCVRCYWLLIESRNCSFIVVKTVTILSHALCVDWQRTFILILEREARGEPSSARWCVSCVAVTVRYLRQTAELARA